MEDMSLINELPVILGAIGTAGLISSIITFFAKTKQDKQEKSVQNQIENLDKISESLNNLQNFIEDQKQSLAENEKIIRELEKEKEQLKPIVETQKETVSAILKAHSNSEKKSRWFDYLMGFFIGVTSSAVVALIFYYLQIEK